MTEVRGQKTEKRTSNAKRTNIQHRTLNGKGEATEIVVLFHIGFMNTKESKLWSEATSLFDVRRWTFDVGRSIFSMFE